MVYVDDFSATFRGMKMCHMMADSEEELDGMARVLGLKRSWRQEHPRGPHYDLSKSKRRFAIHMGAKAITAQEMVKRYPIKKEEKDESV